MWGKICLVTFYLFNVLCFFFTCIISPSLVIASPHTMYLPDRNFLLEEKLRWKLIKNTMFTSWQLSQRISLSFPAEGNMQKIEMISFINFSITLSLGSTRSLGHRDAEGKGMFCQHFQYFSNIIEKLTWSATKYNLSLIDHRENKIFPQTAVIHHYHFITITWTKGFLCKGTLS